MYQCCLSYTMYIFIEACFSRAHRPWSWSLLLCLSLYICHMSALSWSQSWAVTACQLVMKDESRRYKSNQTGYSWWLHWKYINHASTIYIQLTVQSLQVGSCVKFPQTSSKVKSPDHPILGCCRTDFLSSQIDSTSVGNWNTAVFDAWWDTFCLIICKSLYLLQC